MLSTTNICRSFFTRIRLLFQKVHTMSSAPSMDRHAVTLVNALTRSLNPSSSPVAGDGDDMRVREAVLETLILICPVYLCGAY